MLKIHKVGAGGEDYYLTVCDASLRPDGLVEPPGTWLGALVAPLGLDGAAVTRATLAPLLAGREPCGESSLDPRHNRVRVRAYDCTFAAPKSVSLLHALGEPSVVDQVRGAHEQSVGAALGYLEREAACVRRSGRCERTGALVAASFLHRTSRALDPHLHCHVVVANLGVDGTGRWSALDARQLYAHTAAAGELFRSQLRHELHVRLGLRWRAGARGFSDLLGVSGPVIEAFSTRSAAISASLEASGGSGPFAAAVSADATRPARDLSRSYDELVDSWRRRASALGVTRSVVARAGAPPADAARVATSASTEARAIAAKAVSATERPFVRREVVRAVASLLVDGAPLETVESAVGEVIASELVVAQEAPSTRRLGRARTVPGAFAEQSYRSPAQAELGARLVAILEAARPLESPDLSPGVVEVGARRDRLEVADALAALARRVASGRSVEAFAPTTRAALAIEALTGVTARRLGEGPAPLPGSLLLVVAPWSMPLARVVPLLESAFALGTTAVVLDDGGADRPGRAVSAVDLAEPVEFGRAERHLVGDARVVLARQASDAAALARSIRGALARQPGGAIGLASDARLAAVLGEGWTAPAALGPALRREPDAALVVLGGARLLSGRLGRVGEARRIHVAVAPAAGFAGGRRARAIELVEPAHLCRRIGRPPSAPAERASWRIEALALEGRAESLALAATRLNLDR